MGVEKQDGFTLTEILISLALGLIVIGAVSTIYLSTVGSSASILTASKLNQELTALMTVMTNDIRRASYWGNMAGGEYRSPQSNFFAQVDTTALAIMASNVQTAANSAVGGECIVYVYDADDDGTLDNEDIRGFRLSNGVAQMRQRGDTAANTRHDSCNDADDVWADVTDANLISVTMLNFSLGESECLNTREPNDLDDDGDGTVDGANEYDCYTLAPAIGDITTETRQVRITVTGALAGDPDVTATLTQDVRVRNDLVRVR